MHVRLMKRSLKESPDILLMLASSPWQQMSMSGILIPWEITVRQCGHLAYIYNLNQTGINYTSLALFIYT